MRVVWRVVDSELVGAVVGTLDVPLVVKTCCRDDRETLPALVIVRSLVWPQALLTCWRGRVVRCRVSRWLPFRWSTVILSLRFVDGLLSVPVV